MESKKRIFKNTFVLSVSHILSKILYFAALVVITRSLGVNEYGQFAFALSFVLLFSVLTDLGLNTLTVRDLARNKEFYTAYLKKALQLKLLLSAAGLAVLLISAEVVSLESHLKTAVYILAFKMILDGFSNLVFSVFRAFEKMEYEAVLNTLEKGGILIFAVLFISLPLNLINVSLIFALVAVLKFVLALVLLSGQSKSLVDVAPVKANITILGLLKKSWPFGLIAVMSTIHFSFDTLMLKGFQGDASVGIYNAAHKLIDGLGFMPQVFAAALFPVFAALFVIDAKELSYKFSKTMKILYTAALPICIGGAVLSAGIINILYGEAFLEASGVLAIMFGSLFFIFLNYGTGTTLNSVNLQKLLLRNTALSVLINIVLNLLLIPSYSHYGAALATLASQGLLFFMSYITLKEERIRLDSLPFLKALGSAVLMGGIIYFAGFNVFIGIPVGAFLYMGLILIFKVFDKDEIGAIKNTFFGVFSSK